MACSQRWLCLTNWTHAVVHEDQTRAQFWTAFGDGPNGVACAVAGVGLGVESNTGRR
ncbi:hypothetical protein HSB1_01070 [Halogranum salarium B-1]|uniref:Uncharacterized protein n=1 Tax=Halogranum salarium B-1 TaxID=1210908 RepID=J3JHK8_9EURY|nr:hypothetical protein HSB1_01070 [Halogranum salarium B-1]